MIIDEIFAYYPTALAFMKTRSLVEANLITKKVIIQESTYTGQETINTNDKVIIRLSPKLKAVLYNEFI